ncbi:MAG: hypothetical protein ACOC4C_00745 [Fibrobacterota bacterium]
MKSPLVRILLLFVFVLSIIQTDIQAKSRRTLTPKSHTFYHAATKSRRIQLFEETFTPSLEAKIRGEQYGQDDSPPLSQADITFLAKHWSALSPAFRTLYQMAFDIPLSFKHYISPSNRFEIYYTLSGADAVPDEDTYGYGYDGDWRVLVRGGNGIPDYVDEVAWAFDSAWSMEVERFNFPAPFVYQTSRFNSERYKVVINQQSPGYYGLTYFSGLAEGQVYGGTSLIHLRNEWNGWDEGTLDYETHPEKAIHITAAHEFFHAIHYSVGPTFGAGDIDYPASWLEGTAVLMEELAFDHINDYMQYVDGFFLNPKAPMLDNTANGYVEYKNSLIAIYLYESTYDQPAIDFIRDVFMIEYTPTVTFNRRLQQASRQAGKSWPQIFSRFFAESYFTGTRAESNMFIQEAEDLRQWRYKPDTLSSIKKMIAPHCMQIYSYGRTNHSPDSLDIYVHADELSSPSWGIQTILLSDQINDTIISIAADGINPLHQTIAHWKNYDSALVIIANADPFVPLNATVSFGSEIEGVGDSPTVEVFPNPVARRGNVRFQGKTIQDITIRSLDGNVVAYLGDARHMDSKAFGRKENDLLWNTKNGAGKSVVCGSYVASVGYKNGKNEISHKHFKILVIP